MEGTEWFEFQIDRKDAMQRLNGMLPADVLSLVSISSDNEGNPFKGRFDGVYLQTARGILNEMILDVVKELIDVIFDCKEFQERSRGTFVQVVGDIARLGSQLVILGDKRVEASEGNTTGAFPTATIDTLPVATEPPNPDGQARKCTDGTPNRGLLRDLLSTERGKFRNSFVEVASKRKQNQDEYENLTGNMKGQLTVLNDLRTKHMETLAEAISAINADTEEMNEKDNQKRDLQKEYGTERAKFHAAYMDLLVTGICGGRMVWNQIMWDNTVSPSPEMSDCDVTVWCPNVHPM